VSTDAIKAITLKFPRSHTRVNPAHERTHNGEGVAEFFPISATPSNDSGVEKRPQPRWPLLREAIAGFLNPRAVNVNASAVVIYLVACDQEICSGCPRVRPDA